jgi:hypothetical protein
MVRIRLLGVLGAVGFSALLMLSLGLAAPGHSAQLSATSPLALSAGARERGNAMGPEEEKKAREISRQLGLLNIPSADVEEFVASVRNDNRSRTDHSQSIGVLNVLGKDLPALVGLVRGRSPPAAAVVEQSLRLIGNLFAVFPGGKVAGTVLRLIGQMVGGIFGARPQRPPVLTAAAVLRIVDSTIREHVWDVAATQNFDIARSALEQAPQLMQPWLTAFADEREYEGENGTSETRRRLTREIMADSSLFTRPQLVSNLIWTAQQNIQSGARARDQQVRAIANPTGLFDHMCTSWDFGDALRGRNGSGQVKATGRLPPGNPCSLLLRQPGWSELRINANGNIVWPNVPGWGDANGGECNRCTCVEGWTEPTNGFFRPTRPRFNRHNEACVERADRLPACTRAYDAADANEHRLTSPDVFRRLLRLHEQVVAVWVIAFFLMEPYFESASLRERAFDHVFSVEFNLRRAESWGTGEPCSRHYSALASTNQNRLPSTPTGRAARHGTPSDRQIWDRWCANSRGFSDDARAAQHRICRNVPRDNGSPITANDPFNWRDYNVIRYAESVP